MQKRIRTEDDMTHFVTSSAYHLLNASLEKFCLLSKGVLSNSNDYDHPAIVRVLKLLNSIELELSQIDPIVQPMRFGNKAFRIFHARLAEVADGLICNAVDGESLLGELRPYLLDSFGNPTRIDYGTGHELSFFAFLVILVETEVLPEKAEVVTVLFREYLRLVRLVVSKYCMEPAGSHGVWGLDDYHHLPFLFGAAQLIGHEKDLCSPPEIFGACMNLKTKSLFADALTNVKETKCKHAPFREVAPILSDLVSRTDNWSVCCYGLLKLYKAEVLGKKPVVQHFIFGRTFIWN